MTVASVALGYFLPRDISRKLECNAKRKEGYAVPLDYDE
jgi:hypothetical protein